VLLQKGFRLASCLFCISKSDIKDILVEEKTVSFTRQQM
jgi:hypothetical protein